MPTPTVFLNKIVLKQSTLLKLDVHWLFKSRKWVYSKQHRQWNATHPWFGCFFEILSRPFSISFYSFVFLLMLQLNLCYFPQPSLGYAHAVLTKQLSRLTCWQRLSCSHLPIWKWSRILLICLEPKEGSSVFLAAQLSPLRLCVGSRSEGIAVPSCPF